MNRPNFFIVGAPKCGTTAMNDCLCGHPQVFMAAKELHFFGADLPFRERIAQPDYEAHFAGAAHATVRGEASVWYLYSKTAAAEIYEYNPAARIVIMLRHPVAVLHSLHSQHLYDGNETEASFAKALELDGERKAGRQLPDAVDYHHLPSYFDTVDFAPQVQRFLDVFGSAQVHIVWHDTFLEHPEQVVSDVCRFLGLSPCPGLSFGRVNANRNIRSLWLHRIIKKPPSVMQWLVRRLLPARKIRRWLMNTAYRNNLQHARRAEMPAALKKRLQQQLAPNILSLQAVTGRNLAHWLPVAAAQNPSSQ